MSITLAFSCILITLHFIIVFLLLIDSDWLGGFHFLQAFQYHCIFFIDSFSLFLLNKEVKWLLLCSWSVSFHHLWISHTVCKSNWIVRKKVHCIGYSSEMTLCTALIRRNKIIWHNRRDSWGNHRGLFVGESANIHLIWIHILVCRVREGLIGRRWLIDTGNIWHVLLVWEHTIMWTVLECVLASCVFIERRDWVLWWGSLNELLIGLKTIWGHRSTTLKDMLTIFAL